MGNICLKTEDRTYRITPKEYRKGIIYLLAITSPDSYMVGIHK